MLSFERRQETLANYLNLHLITKLELELLQFFELYEFISVIIFAAQFSFQI